MKSQKKLIVAAMTILMLGLLGSTAVFAQEEGGGFSEEFDSMNWEGWEHSQDVRVENGVLRIDPGNFVLRFGEWSEIDLSVRVKLSTGSEVVINYYLRDEGHYSLMVNGEIAILNRISGDTPIGIGEAEYQNFNNGDWNDINIKVDGGNQTISLNGVSLITATDPQPLTAGAVMLHVFGAASSEFDSLSLTGIPTGEMPLEGGDPGDGGDLPPEGDKPGEPSVDSAAPALNADTSAGSTETQSLLDEFMSGQSNQLELSTFLINLLLAVVASFILGRVYVYWGTSLSNRRAFASNFILLTVTTTFIILVVRSSVALSLGLVGALSIVRFRAAVKEPEELAYLFFAISLGIGLGDNQRLITLLTLLVGIAVMGLMHVFRKVGADVNLHLTISTKNPYKVELDQVTAVLEKHCSKIKLLRYDETPELLESSYVIEFKKVSDLSKAKAELQTLSQKMEISFLDNKGIW